MSFREAMPPRTTHQGLCPWTPLGDFRSPDPLCPTSKSWLRHWFRLVAGVTLVIVRSTNVEQENAACCYRNRVICLLDKCEVVVGAA